MQGRSLELRPAVANMWVLPAAVTLVVVTVLEIATFVEVTRTIGAVWATVLLVTGSLAGALVLRHERARARSRVRAYTDDGHPAGPAVTDSMVGIFGAVLLTFPGFFTAMLGLVLLLPPSRLLIRRSVERSLPGEDDLFGPRRVRVHTGDAAADRSASRAPAGAIEGEAG
ncbi:FxsA family protein [Actinoplanes sp. NPDC026619]|uniref:FxsA family protein n=1 Tax=Actinoplanes sp. NPDC026619 TaxID=3155798 RepID=UPI0033FFE296